MTTEGDKTSDRRWVGWASAALGATLWHTRIDQHIGLMGPTSDVMSPLQAAAALLGAAVAAWWVFLIADALTGRADSVRAVLVVVSYQAVLMHGLVAFVAAPPPSAAFPYQDLAHGASLVAGVLALYSLVRTEGTGVWGARSWITLALLVSDSAVGAALMVSSL